MPELSRRKILKSILLASLSGFTSLIGTRSFGSANRKRYEDFTPAYVKLHKNGELRKRGEKLWALMESCELCPRMCGVNKLEGEQGFCQADCRLEISSFHPHFGEEKPLVGNGGSGTIFLTNCGLRCVFCINWEVSQKGDGSVTSIEALSQMMMALQEKGCANINFVTPTHYSPHIVLGLDKAAAKGLKLPVVYNTCGWERPEILGLLDGIVDIYLPDFKYSDGKKAAKYSSGAGNYVDITQQAILEMYRQVGTVRPTKSGLIKRGLMIRHLVMPNNVSGTKGVIAWIAKNLPKNTYLNLMSQYRPMYKAFEYSEISRKITRSEYTQAINWARSAGLTNLEIQGYHFI
jgi:putative pyruvate formate lyase activating enzyme